MSDGKGMAASSLDPPTTKKKGSKKEKNGPGDLISKFQGEGLSFKAKLYGIVDVKEARGDAMCQQTLQLLKATAKSNTQHKQKIMLRINIDGVFVIDSSTNQTLMEHQVSRVSFISKDSTDSKSFCYVVGNHEGKHKLYGLKTEKPAETVMLTFRDLFQAVYQLKQQESQQKRASHSSSQSADSNQRDRAESVTLSNTSLSNKAENAASDLPLNIPVSAPELSPSNQLTHAAKAPDQTEGVCESLTAPADNKSFALTLLGEGQSSEDNSSVPLTADESATTHSPAPDEFSSKSHQLLEDSGSEKVNDDTDASDQSPQKEISANQEVTNAATADQIFTQSPITNAAVPAAGVSVTVGEEHSSDIDKPPILAESATLFESTVVSTFCDLSVSDLKDTSARNINNVPLSNSTSRHATTTSVAMEKPKDTASLWADEANINNDPFCTDSNSGSLFVTKLDVVATDETNPWGTVESSAATGGVSDACPWASFDNEANWASPAPATVVPLDNTWGSSDPWADSPFTLTEQRKSSSASTGEEHIITDKPIEQPAAASPKVVYETTKPLHENDRTDSVNNTNSQDIGDSFNPNTTSFDRDDTSKQSSQKSEQLLVEHDPFENADPFSGDSFFSSDPFSNETFATDAAFTSDLNSAIYCDPFAKFSDPFASIVPPHDPFNIVNDSFTDFSIESEKANTPNTEGMQSKDLAETLVNTNTTTVETSPVAVTGEAAERNIEKTPIPQLLEAEINSRISYTAGSGEDKSDASSSLAPPSCPPPTLPPEVLASIEVEKSSVPVKKRAPPPAIPTRRPPSVSSQITSPTTPKPPVPSRNINRTSVKLENSVPVDNNILESVPPSSPAPSLPVPSFPAPTVQPPPLPLRTPSIEPPKIPHRRSFRNSHSDEMPVVKRNSVPLSLPPSVEGTDC